MLNIGPQELLVILVIALIVVGPQRLPALGRSIGRGLRELRKAQDEVKRTIQVNLDDEPPNGSSATPAPARGAPGSADRRATDPKPVAPDPTPTASEPLPADEIRNISRSLGASLAELRRAKEEVQRSFRIDVAPTTKPATSKRPQPATPAQPASPVSTPTPADATEPSEAPAERAARNPEPSPDAEPATSDRATD
jgi:sec-independent protein translocase protein TatA